MKNISDGILPYESPKELTSRKEYLVLLKSLLPEYMAQTTDKDVLIRLLNNAKSLTHIKKIFEKLFDFELEQIQGYIEKNRKVSSKSPLELTKKYYTFWDESLKKEIRKKTDVCELLLLKELRLSMALWYDLSFLMTTFKEVYSGGGIDTFLSHSKHYSHLVTWVDSLRAKESAEQFFTSYPSCLLALQKILQQDCITRSIEESSEENVWAIQHMDQEMMLLQVEDQYTAREFERLKTIYLETQVKHLRAENIKYRTWKEADATRVSEHIKKLTSQREVIRNLSMNPYFVQEQADIYSLSRDNSFAFLLPEVSLTGKEACGIELVHVYNEYQGMVAHMDQEDEIDEYQGRVAEKNRICRLPLTRGDGEVLAVGTYLLDSSGGLSFSGNQLIPFEKICKTLDISLYEYLQSKAITTVLEWAAKYADIEKFPLQYADYFKDSVKHEITPEEADAVKLHNKLQEIQDKYLTHMPTFTAAEVRSIIQKMGMTIIQGAGDHSKAISGDVNGQRRPVVINEDHEFTKAHILKLCADLGIPPAYFMGVAKKLFSGKEIADLQKNLQK